MKLSTTTTQPGVESARASPVASQGQIWSRANAAHVALYFRQMHALLDAGVTVAYALEEVSRGGGSRALRSAASEMSRCVAAGQPWSQAMRAYPGLFSELMIAIIHSGETSGSLARMCLRLSEYAEAEYRIQQAIKRETWYPKLLLFFSTVIVPLPVTISLAGQPFVLGFGTQLLLLAIPWGLWKLANFLWPVGARGGKPRYWIDHLKLELPLIGPTTRSLAIARFCRTLGLLTAAGVGVATAFGRAADACDNVIIADKLRRVLPRLNRGETLTAALTATGEFPSFTLQMLGTGETTGAIDEMLQKSADFLEAEAETTLHKSVKTLGVIVLFLAAIKIGVQVVQWWQRYYGV